MAPMESTVSVETPPETMTSEDVTVVLNVGGMKHETYMSTLKSFPGTKLSNPDVLALHFRPKVGDYFFDRHPLIFAAILNYYRIGLLHVPQDVCAAVVRSELEYWGIDEVDMEDCCWLGYSVHEKTGKLLSKFGIDKKSLQKKADSAPKPAKTKLGRFRATMWKILEEPFSSRSAKVYTAVSILMTVASLGTLLMSTHPAFLFEMTVDHYAHLYSASHEQIRLDLGIGHDHQPELSPPSHDDYDDLANIDDQNNTDTTAPMHDPDTPTEAQNIHQTTSQSKDNVPARKKRDAEGIRSEFRLSEILEFKGSTAGRSKRSVINTTILDSNMTRNRTGKYKFNSTFRAPDTGRIIADYVCRAFFTLELLIRFIVCPSKRRFFTTWITWLDLACILPYYIELLLDTYIRAEHYQETVLDALTAMGIFRVLRIMKSFRFNHGVRVLAYTMRSSLREMFIMVLLISTAVFFFGSLMYYGDHSSGSFKTLPDAAWWALVTLTTVGYGDIAPKTIIGRIIGSCCAISGIMLVSFTIPVIVNNFLTFYGFVNANREELIKSKRQNKNCSISTIFSISPMEPVKRSRGIYLTKF